jgi:phosphoribosylamine-glycine ligase
MADFARDKFWVIEFNCRFGDPETQAMLVRMEDDLLAWCEAVATGGLQAMPPNVKFSSASSVVVAVAAKGYPEKPEFGAVIENAEKLVPPAYFCAGLKKNGAQLQTNGGRVFGAMGTGPTLKAARKEAYDRVQAVKFSGMHYRKDIGGLK